MSRVIGIDLGTTHTLCAVFGEHGPQLVPNRVGCFLTPSVVGRTGEGRVLTGMVARDMNLIHPCHCAARFKRHMGTDAKLMLAGERFSAIELSSLLLKTMKRDAEAHLGTSVDQAVITVPAYFNDHQRKATKLAGELAGFQVRRIINEPTAAALTYGFHERDNDRRVLVFDLGGGTLDVTLMEIFEGTLEIIATSGQAMLGGEDFTEAVVSWCLRQQGRDPASLRGSSPQSYARLWRECEAAKIQLSRERQVDVRIPDREGRFSPNCAQVTLDRGVLADVLSPFKARIMDSLHRALRDGKTRPEDIDSVILVGGATRMPLIAEMLEDYFQKPPLCRYNPDEVVAMGAAVQAALLEDHKEVEDLVLTDVCPFTLGIAVAKQLGREYRDGYFLPIIHRNTTLPVSKEEVVFTLYANQKSVDVKIFQGESRKIKDNHPLGELKVSGIPPAPGGHPIYVRFTYDLNGILEVEAVVSETGTRFQTVLTHHVKGLDEREIEAAVARMQEIKFYPRDQEEYQHLLFFAEQVLAEVAGEERRTLETVLDEFESAMWDSPHYEEGETWFRDAHQALLSYLEDLGYAFRKPPEESDFGRQSP
ncbi:Hsp70 family protein [Sulfidibacter corallicola]|uniref:Hsp70 family protein n=1 Tax=Sulfidibacter corallicola TaxID=2818388 RepID=A0A8A4TDL8_SULCO|nr:Hsp70 family protein [Sulfidibacter corallicola]QTD48189.1 Hsp70 family protein [Sulfidibacter corallicola]